VAQFRCRNLGWADSTQTWGKKQGGVLALFENSGWASSSKPLQIYTLLFWRVSFVRRHSLLYYSVWPIPWANLNHHRVQKFAITTITDGTPKNIWGKRIHPVFPSTGSCFTTGKDTKKLIMCVIVVWKNVSQIDFLPVHILQVSFGHCRPLAASQVNRRKDMEVLHKFAQP